MLLEVGLLKRKTKQNKIQKVWAIPVPISTTKDVICCSNGYIYHFLDCIKLLPMSFTMSKNVEHSSEKTPRELMERFTNLMHL